MELRRLELRNHRNYAHLDLVPGAGVNVFIGPNGQGKTNLLEAVAMLALSSSPRARPSPELVRYGSEIAAGRAKAVRELQPVAARAHAEVADGERLEIAYDGPPDDFADAVQKSLTDDLRRGVTTVGPHHDDVLIELDGRDARSYASQGQQRTAVVSLKLAEAELMAARTGERPVLLLDDVLSELDGERRAALLNEVGDGGQVIITSVEAGPFPPELIARAMVWTVEEGRIQACG